MPNPSKLAKSSRQLYEENLPRPKTRLKRLGNILTSFVVSALLPHSTHATALVEYVKTLTNASVTVSSGSTWTASDHSKVTNDNLSNGWHSATTDK